MLFMCPKEAWTPERNAEPKVQQLFILQRVVWKVILKNF